MPSMEQLKKLTLLLFAAVIAFAVLYTWLISQSSTPVEGVLQVRLINRCKLDIYDKPLQPFRTVVISCPRMDMIRVWPLPIQHPWFEDWCEPVEGLENARVLPNVL